MTTPTTYKPTLVVRFFFYYWLCVIPFAFYVKVKSTMASDFLLLSIFGFVALIFYCVGSQYIRIEGDRYIYKRYPFISPEEIFWKNIIKVEVETIPPYGLKRLVIGVKGSSKPERIGIGLFRSDEMKQFLAKIKEMAPGVKLPETI